MAAHASYLKKKLTHFCLLQYNLTSCDYYFAFLVPVLQWE